MAILNEQINGTKIINEIQSSNIRKTEYDTQSKDLVVEFNNGLRYSYENVPHQVYTQFRMSESQGKYFNSKIAKNYKYKKLPVVIEAFQMTKERKEDHSEWPVWLNKAYRKYRFDEGSLYNAESSISTFRSKKGMFCIHTLEGEHLVQWNDYIIRGVNGELYPCKEEVFLKTYEEHKE
jgi:hypothetical protein